MIIYPYVELLSTTHFMPEKNIEQIKKFLLKFGLDSKESSVYLQCLSSGPEHVSRIAKACGLTRTNAYDIVKKLEARGLCYNMGSLYGRKIKANPPKHLE